MSTPYPERVYTPPLDDDPYKVHARGEGGGSRPLLMGGLMAVVVAAAGGAAWNTYGAGPPTLITAPGDYKVAVAAPIAPVPDTSEVYRVMEGASVINASAPGRPPAPSPIDLHPGGGGPPQSILAQPAAPVAPSITVKPGPVAAASGQYLAQLAALRSEDAARTFWNETATRSPALLMGARMDLQRADLGPQGVFFRLRAGYFTDRDQAGTFCERMKSAGLACMVVSQ